jgi:ABC-type branched-subunit amino acid transport system ATPase component
MGVIAHALLLNPALLLMHEPTEGLGPNDGTEAGRTLKPEEPRRTFSRS